MRDRYLKLVATIATSVTIACGDAAVEEVTAPPLAATPASPVANQYPTVEELSPYAQSGPFIRITGTSFFEAGYQTFLVVAEIALHFVNEASATVNASLINKNGQTVNTSSAGFAYSRFALPVVDADTTITLRVSTNNTTCGLVGKGSYSGAAALKAVNQVFLVVQLWGMRIETTHLGDVPQPACPPPPPPPPDCDGPATRVVANTTGILASESEDCDEAPPAPGGGGAQVYVCFTVWREYWTYDLVTGRYTLVAVWPIGVTCQLVQL